jgi:hypothetical protein
LSLAPRSRKLFLRLQRVFDKLTVARFSPREPREAPFPPTGLLFSSCNVSAVPTLAQKYHRDRYPDVHAEEITFTVLKTFGEIAACKIAHTQKLAKYITEEEIDDTFRTEEALTASLMGLIAEDSLIAQRLTKLGRKKQTRRRDLVGMTEATAPN